MEKVFNLSPAVASHAPLCHWHEITGQPGLLHCINQTSGNPVLVMVTPDKILVSLVLTGKFLVKADHFICTDHDKIVYYALIQQPIRR